MDEFDLIDRYLKPLATSPGADGLSNDVAILNTAGTGAAVVTVDTLVSDVHFLADDPLHYLARKLVRVNVSDILCKGARPKDALLSLALPSDISESSFAEFCAALGEEFRLWGISLIGGDTVRTPGPLTVTMTLTGHCVGKGPTLRSTARPGHQIWVTNQVGHGFLGLRDARAKTPSKHAEFYRSPDLPPMAIADLIANFATSSIDVSDGLLSDAAHIGAESAVQMTLDLGTIPFAASVTGIEAAVQLATAGDDYQTLFTVPASAEFAMQEQARADGIELTRIGMVEAGRGLELRWKGETVAVPSNLGYRHNSES
ncbi:thiamine-phosphate kinase [Henriciella litoralis]|uniref:thiamine-phosphate kinase n=1 Tax=Henriciella litoralis TaxID=568102 RepID=UPI0009FBE102|nr:thiamine-phosphate kinase [Henriciella litoralis]